MARILVIDDDASARLVVAETLRVTGYTVDEASAGRRGLAVYRAEPPEFVITDIFMPD